MRSSVLAQEVAEVYPSHRSDGSYHNDDQVKGRLLAKLRERFLLESPEIPVVDAVFEDLELVLGEHAELTMAQIADLAPRLHAVFRRTAHVATQANSGVLPATLLEYRSLLVERFPFNFIPALAHIRRLAMAVSDLLDEVLEEML